MKTCTKVSYSDHRVGPAQRALQRSGKRMRAYKCDKCFRWHLTSSLKGEYSLGLRRKK